MSFHQLVFFVGENDFTLEQQRCLDWLVPAKLCG